MPLKPESALVIYEGVPKKGWKGGEDRHYLFMDNGADFNHSEHGLSYLYHVRRIDKGFDPNKDWTLFVKPNSALAIALTKMLTPQNESLRGRTFKFHKVTGEEFKDTRYEVTEIFEG